MASYGKLAAWYYSIKEELSSTSCFFASVTTDLLWEPLRKTDFLELTATNHSINVCFSVYSPIVIGSLRLILFLLVAVGNHLSASALKELKGLRPEISASHFRRCSDGWGSWTAVNVNSCVLSKKKKKARYMRLCTSRATAVIMKFCHHTQNTWFGKGLRERERSIFIDPCGGSP